MSAAAFHNVLTAMGAPAELGDALLAALRLGHDLAVPERGPSNTWVCRRCKAWADWESETLRRSPRLRLSCVEAIREAVAMGQAGPAALAWLAGQEAGR